MLPVWPSLVANLTTPIAFQVVERNRHIRAEARDQRIREYFYGPASQYFPHSFEVRFGDVKIHKIGAPALPDSLMPLGMKAEDQLTKLVTVQPSMQILHHLLAVSMAENPEDDVVQTNVMGFICVYVTHSIPHSTDTPTQLIRKNENISTQLNLFYTLQELGRYWTPGDDRPFAAATTPAQDPVTAVRNPIHGFALNTLRYLGISINCLKHVYYKRARIHSQKKKHLNLLSKIALWQGKLIRTLVLWGFCFCLRKRL